MMTKVPAWTNEETAIVWARGGEQAAQIIGCDPHNPSNAIDIKTAKTLMNFSNAGRFEMSIGDDPLHDLAISRIDWAQIAQHLSDLARPEGAIGPQFDCYVAARADESLSFGDGNSPVEARIAELCEAEKAIETHGGIITFPATEWLAEATRDGGCHGWSYCEGLGCTYEEIQGVRIDKDYD